jgi:hypothetical protein
MADFLDTPQRGIEATWVYMVVVQEDPEASLFEWARAYWDAAYESLASWVAFPRILADRRVELIAGLHKMGWWSDAVEHHAFGMNAGSLAELPQLNTLGIYSCDSSAPVWRGLHGCDIESKTWEDHPFNPHWTDAGYDPRHVADLRKLAETNLEEVHTACQQKWAMPSVIKAASTSSRG